MFLLRGVVLFKQPVIPFGPSGYWASVLYHWIPEYTIGSSLLGMALVFVQALLVNALVHTYRMSGTLSNYVPAATYVLLTCLYPEYLVLSPVLIANTFLLLSLTALFKTYKQISVAKDLFDSGLYLGAACLFYNVYIIFLIALFMGWQLLRGNKTKEIYMISTGFLVPFFLNAIYLFWTDQLGGWPEIFMKSFRFINLDIFPKEGVSIFKVIFWIIFGLVAVFNFNQFYFKQKIRVQKNISALYWYMIIGSFGIFFQANAHLEHALIICVPLSIFMALSLNNARSSLSEIFFFIMVIAAFCFQVLAFNESIGG